MKREQSDQKHEASASHYYKNAEIQRRKRVQTTVGNVKLLSLQEHQPP